MLKKLNYLLKLQTQFYSIGGSRKWHVRGGRLSTVWEWMLSGCVIVVTVRGLCGRIIVTAWGLHGGFRVAVRSCVATLSLLAARMLSGRIVIVAQLWAHCCCCRYAGAVWLCPRWCAGALPRRIHRTGAVWPGRRGQL